MKRRPRNRTRPKAKGGLAKNTQNLIVLLLVVLIILTAANLYFNHMNGKANSTVTRQTASSSVKSQPGSAKPSSPSSRDTSRDTPNAVGAVAVSVPLVKPAIVPLLSPDMPAPGSIHIQLLNGCGVPGLASKVRAALRNKGFDVLTFGNAKAQDYSKTLIIARSETAKGQLAARRVAYSLGLTEDQISIQNDPNLVDTDVTLILGADHQNLNLSGD